MASHPHHHHHHHHHHHPPPPSNTTSNPCYCCSCPSNYSPPPHPPPTDPHSIHHPHLSYSFSNPPYPTNNLHPHRHNYQHPPLQTQYPEEHHYCREIYQLHPDGGLSPSNPVVRSLLRRISALESTLHSRTSLRSHSLRHAAARTIQTHFRAFLIRRSRTLRQLKDLASIKSALIGLKSATSNDRRFDARLVSKKASNLLLRLDSIQGNDPMIRDGKMAVGRELTRFLDLVDFTVKRSEVSSSRLVRKNARTGDSANISRGLHDDHELKNAYNCDVGSKRLDDVVKRIDAMYTKVQGFGEDDEEDENLDSPVVFSVGNNSDSQFRDGGLTKRLDGDREKSMKRVSFAKKGYVYRIPRNRAGYDSVGVSSSNGGSDSDASNRKLDDNMGWETVEAERIPLNDMDKDEEVNSEDEASTESSDDGERSPIFNAQLPKRMEA